MNEEDEILAAELAFGLLDPEDRTAAQARLRSDLAFAAAHARWQDHAMELLDGPDEAPSPRAWAAISARLPANDAARVPAGGLRLWRTVSAAAAACSIVLAVLLARPAPPPVVREKPVPPLVAVLTGSGRDDIVTISMSAASRTAEIMPSQLDSGSGDAELWAIPVGGKPRALGVIPHDRRSTLDVPKALAPLLAPGVTLAISLEPKGGSPTGLPTGPVILTGKVAQS